MSKIIIDLFKVNKTCKIKYVLNIYDNPETEKYTMTIKKFDYNGVDYLKIVPYPYITLDIKSSNKNEGWDTNKVINFNRMELYSFIFRLERFYKLFTNERGLFYKDADTDELKVNKSLSDANVVKMYCNNKNILIQACVVNNEEDHRQYEGAFLAINNFSSYTYLTYYEIGFLIYELKKINIDSLTINALNTIKLYKNDESSEFKPKQTLINEEIAVEQNSINPLIFDEEIPKI